MNRLGNSKKNASDRPKHLVILGGGSAAFAAAIKASELGARVTMINDGLPIGGTCVNVGCIPSKTLIRAAEAYYRTTHHNFSGFESQSRITDFRAIVRQMRQLVEELRQIKYIDIISRKEDFRLIEGSGRLAAPNVVEVNGEQIGTDRILIATGASPLVPKLPDFENSQYLTNESVFELDDLPESLIVLGGGYIGLELAQMFSRFGSKVTILDTAPRILMTETADLTDALEGYLKQDGIQVVTGAAVREVHHNGNQVKVEADVQGTTRSFRASHILVATGRKPNTEGLGLERIGVELDPHGFLKVNDTLETTVPGIYGAGDVIGQPMFVYTAAYEGGLAVENAISGSRKTRDYNPLPWVVFTDPQVAGVGWDEKRASRTGMNMGVAVLPLSQVPRSLVAHDTRGFIKLIRNSGTDKLIGARILAPEGSELLMEITLAMKAGITTQELASSFHPYLTLAEGVKLAAISFEKNVNELSCCAH